VAEGPSPFGETIDFGVPDAPEIVEVPEAGAPPRRTRERVRKPVTAVLAEVVTATVEALAPEPKRPELEQEAEAEEEAAPGKEPEPVAGAGEPEPAEADAKAKEGPKRRGWWSRALSGS
jgi:ribonuclease E